MHTKEKGGVSKTLASLFALSALLLVGLVPAAFASGTVVVSPVNMHGWSFVLTDVTGAPGTGTGTGQFVLGPATPPLGSGSANLVTGPGQGDGSAQIATSNFDGSRLDALTSLSYYTYTAVNNGQQFPYLQLSISTGLVSPSQDILFFEPPYQTTTTGNPTLPDQGPTVMNTWQSWNALEGGWWDDNGLAGPGTGVQPLSFFLTHYPTVVIESYSAATNTLFSEPIQGIALTVGFASSTDNFNGNVDAFAIGVSGTQTVYNFETTPCTTVTPSDQKFGVSITAAVVATTPQTITGEVDATSCDVGVYIAPGTTGVTVTAFVHDANKVDVFNDGGGATVTGSTITKVGNHVGTTFSPNGGQTGIGVYYSCTASGTISSNTINQYQKGGIVVRHLDGVSIKGNTVTGLGKVNFIAQNGIEAGFGICGPTVTIANVGHISGNTVTGNQYSGGDRSSPGTTSTGILVEAPSGSSRGPIQSALTSANTVNNNQSNVFVFIG